MLTYRLIATLYAYQPSRTLRSAVWNWLSSLTSGTNYIDLNSPAANSAMKAHATTCTEESTCLHCYKQHIAVFVRPIRTDCCPTVPTLIQFLTQLINMITTCITYLITLSRARLLSYLPTHSFTYLLAPLLDCTLQHGGFAAIGP